MFLHLPVILFTGGCLDRHAPWAENPPPGRHPLQADTPLGRHPPWADNPPGQTPPPGRHLLQADTPLGQTTPLGRHPLQADTFWADSSLGRHPLDRHPFRADTPETATAADGTHSTGMHSCFSVW